MIKKFKYIRILHCLFGSVKLTKNSDPEKYVYISYGIGSDSRSEFSWPDSSIWKNVIIFGADMSSFVDIDNRRKDILILGEKATQKFDATTKTAASISTLLVTHIMIIKLNHYI